MKPFKTSPMFHMTPAAPAMPPAQATQNPSALDTIHALNEEISRRRNNMYANPGEKITNETNQPSYFTGIKRILRSKYGGV